MARLRDTRRDGAPSGSRRSRWAIACGALVGLLVMALVGRWLMPPPPVPVELGLPMASADPVRESPPAGADGGATSSSSPSPPAGAAAGGSRGSSTETLPSLTVHAAGAVVHPGLYQLPSGARVAELVAAAGGLAPDADPDRVNLASPLNDGQRVYLPRRGEAVPPVESGDNPGPPAAGGDATGSGGAGAAAGAPVNLNEASAEQLETLPGVGPATAAAIIDHRRRHGPFSSVDDLLDVRGIGPAKLAQLRDRVTV